VNSPTNAFEIIKVPRRYNDGVDRKTPSVLQSKSCTKSEVAFGCLLPGDDRSTGKTIEEKDIGTGFAFRIPQ